MSRKSQAGARLRRFPHPYRAAVAISNDCEFLTPGAFWDIHRFLNTTEETPLGEGLGLLVTDSAFMYSVDSSRSFSYFEGTSFKPSENAGWLRELMQAGCIDVLHAFGDFDGVGGCTREHAARALEELDRHGIKLSVWSNHGTVENCQNVGGSRAQYQRGDLPDAPEYHTDLLTEYGIRFMWVDWSSTDRFGQEIPVPPSDLVRAMFVTRAIRGWRPKAAEGRLLEVERLRDGNDAYVFRRYRGPDRPDPSTLPAQLSEDHLRHLVETGGVAIIYQHLGCDRRSGTCEPNSPPYFRGEEATALRRLAERHHRGEIMVTGVAKLLRFWAIRRGLVWRAERNANLVRILVERVSDPVLGEFMPEPAHLEGMTWDLADPVNAEVQLAGRPLRVERRLARDGTASVSVPLRPWMLPDPPRRLAGPVK